MTNNNDKNFINQSNNTFHFKCLSTLTTYNEKLETTKIISHCWDVSCFYQFCLRKFISPLVEGS